MEDFPSVGPSGTVTFLFTDVEGSTGMWERDAEAMRIALERHDRALRSAMSDHGGWVFATGGDGFAVAFSRAGDAVAAAVDAQIALQRLEKDTLLKIRMGLHTGEVIEREGDYFGPAVNRAARIMSAAHGGQVLCSAVTAGLVADVLPEGCGLVDLGVNRLRDLAAPERIHQITVPGGPRRFPHLRTLDAFPGNLPLQPTEFIGREAELKEVAACLDEAAVVTLTGVGGVGKTRLALQVAAEVLPRFRDGAWFVELASVGREDAVQDAVSSALGVVGGAAPGAGLIDYLQPKELLLVLDNCEHLLAGVADLVERVVRCSAGVRVLATSREALGVSGEHVRVVGTLGVPDPSTSPDLTASTDAVRLFVARATEANASYRFGDDDAETVAELCRHLDGIPLAIELAAARVSALTPAEISSHLNERFKLLSGGRRTAAGRHQTLRNAIEWSYQLLEAEEKAVLHRLGVFAGGFDLPAAEAVAGSDQIDALEVVDVLGRLVSKSLVIAEAHQRATRYRMLETVREFVWDQVRASGSQQEISRRHAEYFARFASTAGAGLRGPEEGRWRERVQQELSNLRAAVSWAITVGEVRLALQPIADLSDADDQVSPFGLLAETAARIAPDQPLAAVALAMAGNAAILQGDIDQSIRLAAEARSKADQFDRTPEGLWVRCRVANAACITVAARGDNIESFAHQWLEDATQLGDKWCLCEALTLMIGLLDETEGVAAGERALVLARELGSPSRIAFAAVFLAARLPAEESARSVMLLQEATEAAAAARNDWVDYVTSVALCQLHASRGDRLAAGEIAVAAIERYAARRQSGSIIQFAGTVACLLAALGDTGTALLVANWAQHRGYVFHRAHPNFVLFGVTELSDARSALGPHQLDEIDRRAVRLDEISLARLAREALEALTAGASGPAPARS